MKTFAMLSLAATLFSSSSFAGVVTQTIGVGSSVTRVDAVANFENTDALSNNPYSEGGMIFSRINLSLNNNGCGFAGCSGLPGFVGFVGNYMYGAGSGGYFEIAAPGGSDFTGLEFNTGTGLVGTGGVGYFVLWEAYDNSILVDTGSATFLAGTATVIGFSDPTGFDTLRYTASSVSGVNFSSTSNGPAFDKVRAQFDGIAQPVPEPASLALFGLGLACLGFARRRKAN